MRMDRRLQRYQKEMEGDFYAPVPNPPSREQLYSVFLNSAAIPCPRPYVRKHAEQVFHRNQQGDLPEQAKEAIYQQARENAASLINLDDPRCVGLFRNTTEALSFFLLMSGVQQRPMSQRTVLTTDCENVSIMRGIEWFHPQGNPTGKDAITTWPHWYTQRGQQYPNQETHPTQIRPIVMPIEHRSSSELHMLIDDYIRHHNPSALIMSHVVRSTGRRLPVRGLIETARNAKSYYHDGEMAICIDGAQALGNLPEIDFHELDCDMYVASPHKTMMSEVVGLLYFDPKNPRIKMEPLQRLQESNVLAVLDGMFHPNLHISPNVEDEIEPADIAGFNMALEMMRSRGELEGNDFSALDEHRAEVKHRFLQSLQVLDRKTGAYVRSVEVDHPTNFIAPFRIGTSFRHSMMDLMRREYSCDEKEIARALSSQGVSLSFLRHGKIFRASFNADTTVRDDIYPFKHELHSILERERWAPTPVRKIYNRYMARYVDLLFRR